MKSAVSQFLLLGFVTACTASDDGIWFPAEDPGGKADAFTTINGSDIPSTNVDPNKRYMLSRRIDGLQMVGALDMVQDPLVRRIDGIIANMPADGNLHLAELVRMESPNIHPSLFPAEQAALPQLWKMMEAPDTNNSLVGAGAAFGVVDSSLPPGPAIVPANLAITSLSTDYQDAARRLQNVHNNDNNAATLQLIDLDQAIAAPQPFTPAEIQLFHQLQLVFREKAVATSAAETAVSPIPGTYTKDQTLGPIGIHVDGVTHIDEERVMNTSWQLTVRLSATQTQTTTVTLPQDAKLFVLNKDSRDERVTGGGVFAIDNGQYVVEVWKAGQRTFSTNLQTPALTRNETLNLTEQLDYTLTTGISPLVRNIRSAGFANSAYTLKATFDKTVVPPQAPVDQNVLPRLASPVVKLPTGRYTVPSLGNVALLVYPNNVLWVQRGQEMYRLLPYGNNAGGIRYYTSSLQMSFEPTSNVLYTPQFGQVTLSASSRDI
jgi:hypothetical protein